MISQPANIVCRWILIGVLASAASACSTQQPVAKSPAHRNGDASAAVKQRHVNPIGERAAAVALNQLGVPYRYGGSSPRGFDCSGLVQYSYARAGKYLPRTTAALWNQAEPVDSRNLRAGDLLFFSIAGKMSHVGVYIGNGRFVHAPSSGKSVSVENLRSDYYARAFIRAGRPK